MGAIVWPPAMAATASLTLALTLVFPHHGWFWNLPVGILWGGVVLNFDRWIVSSIDYGPLTATDVAPGLSQQRRSKAMQFAVRFTMAAPVGLGSTEALLLARFRPGI